MYQFSTLLVGAFSAVTIQTQPMPTLPPVNSVSTAPTHYAVMQIENSIKDADESTTTSKIAGPKKSEVETRVREYFADTPILIDIARCESTFRQTGPDGKILRGIVNPDDVGVMQINQYYHGDSSKRLGQDIMTLEGNMAYARHLYEVYGADPWSASKPCWSKTSTTNRVVINK